MKLSALEIKSQEFKRALRGLDEAEVQSFLDMVASQWHEIQEDMRRAEERARELETKIVHYQKIEEALQEALTSAKASSKATVAEAERQANLVIKEAEIRARALAREAESRMTSMHESANTIGRRRKEIVARLGAFLRAELEMLDDYREGSRDEVVPEMPHLPRDPFGGETATEGEFEEDQRRSSTAAATVAPTAFDLADAEPQETMPEPEVVDMSYFEDQATEAFAATDEVDESALPEFAEEREPLEHQEHAAPDAGFKAQPTPVEADAGEPDADTDELRPEDTEWRIRRILDNLE